MAKRPARTKVLLSAGEAWRGFALLPEGQQALAEYFTFCNVYNPIESNDPIEMARLNGERNAALRILTLMGLKPGDFIQHAQDDTDLLDRAMRSN